MGVDGSLTVLAFFRNTDYLLVPIAQKSKTVEALRGDGWFFATDLTL